jgi:pantoate--beta-alanine ligase
MLVTLEAHGGKAKRKVEHRLALRQLPSPVSAHVLVPKTTAPTRAGGRAMRVVRTPAAMARLASKWSCPVVLVPTMGALHAGHLALIDRARRAASQGGVVAVSIFVNPTQFGPHEDLSKYPRPLRRDLQLCREHGVDLVFHPDAASMYAADASVHVDEALLSSGLCGAARPGHFRGVCTVVAKLFNLVRPTAAVFGRKDYQQLAVIQRMVGDLNFPVRIIALDTVREADGLALSSRNVYLTPDERAQAPALRRALLRAREAAAAGERDPNRWREIVASSLAHEAPLARVDYIDSLQADTLQPLPAKGRKSAVLAAAVFFGKTRLIDNIEFSPNSEIGGARSVVPGWPTGHDGACPLQQTRLKSVAP